MNAFCRIMRSYWKYGMRTIQYGKYRKDSDTKEYISLLRCSKCAGLLFPLHGRYCFHFPYFKIFSKEVVTVRGTNSILMRTCSVKRLDDSSIPHTPNFRPSRFNSMPESLRSSSESCLEAAQKPIEVGVHVNWYIISNEF